MKWVALFSLAAVSAGLAAAQESRVDLDSLLDELIDRGALARFPAPGTTCRQFSSYDRASTSPDDQATWYANDDHGKFLRVEERDGRQERVMMDAAGPGAVVRLWSANPKGTLRVYLDGSDTPALEGPMTELLGGTGPVPPPLSAERARGWNLYLPIPYAERCEITCDAEDFYYQVNYLTYAPDTPVTSFSMDALRAAADRVERVGQALLAEHAPPAGGWKTYSIPTGEEAAATLPPGPGAIGVLSLRLEHPDLEQALRTTVLRLSFDGEETVWCPVGDFYGNGAGLNPFQDWWRTVREDGSLTCRWVMPYERSATLHLDNLGGEPLVAHVRIEPLDGWTWDDRSMHFHATWRQENPLHSEPKRDWNFVAVEGQGVYVGDNLAVANPNDIWWGEGDEKIWVDGEDFPSHIGTGTEDYYGYAWGSPEVFEGPFNGQPRCDGPGNYGHTLVSRVRSLDAIPFTRSLRFDMEVWHWRECDEGYAATTYFYARPGAKTNRPPAPEEAARGLLDPPPLPPPYQIEGALECEALEVVAKTEGIKAEAQGGFGENLWSNDLQLWVQGQAVGDFVELRVPAPADGRYRVELWATRSWDYGVVAFGIDGRPTGFALDLFNLEGKKVSATGPEDLGVHAVHGGALTLRCEVVGGNPASEGTRSFFGLDCVRLTPVDQ